MNAKTLQLRSKLATHVRYHPNDTQTHDEIRRDLRAARCEEYIEQVLAEDPPLTDDQRQRLVVMLADS